MNEENKQSENVAEPSGKPDSKTVTERQAPSAELTAAAVGRMLGLATVADINLVEAKIDLLSSKLNQLVVKVEKLLGSIQKGPTGADLERIDVQIGSLKAAMLEFVAKNSGSGNETGPRLHEVRKQPEPSKTAEEKPVSRKKITMSSLDT